ncbi:hypothetical protein MG290_12235 [Flavobacterium sp. CBA20B-1]|uniref:hypothetical protein n=1 Tax=unclassified Flavobacterium TaxID=196869 RepID=UPI0022254DFA|nr:MULTISPECIES: hypothetical protein [unclassified Flavobacterium]WCM41706.1 hypothetical protein MG290_12235 [Flavobacterium sp. CBA20B-1]
MNTTVTYTAIILLLIFGFVAKAQESITPENFDLPKNTVKAVVRYTDFSIPQQQFSVRPSYTVYTFKNDKIVCLQYEDTASMVKTTVNYQYENDYLKSKETLQNSNAGTERKINTYRTEKQDYKTTFYRTYPTEETDKTILFYNEAGELRGKSFYNVHGKRTEQIEYNGKEGYRLKKYFDEKLMTDITYVNDSNGKLTKSETIVLPGEDEEVKVLTLYYYNPNGDLKQVVDFITEAKNSGKKISRQKHYTYLYDGDVWVAQIEYSLANNKKKNLIATIRTLETPEKIYNAPSDEQLKVFFQETYQKYLKLSR